MDAPVVTPEVSIVWPEEERVELRTENANSVLAPPNETTGLPPKFEIVDVENVSAREDVAPVNRNVGWVDVATLLMELPSVEMTVEAVTSMSN